MAGPGDSQSQSGSKSDGGNKLSDAFAGFAAEAVKWSSAPAPDPKVSTSFSLGWHVAQAKAAASAGEQPQYPHGVERELRWAILKGQIEAARTQLLDDAAPTPDDATAFGELQDELLRDLYVVDSAAGKAFLLGEKLHDLQIKTAEDAKLFLAGHDAVEPLLRDVASKLPANAAHSVMNSLSLWDGQLAPPAQGRGRRPALKPPSSDLAKKALARQKPIWFSMLAGEVGAKDLLRLSDYVGTGEEVVKRLRELATRALETKTGVAVAALVLVLLAAGAALLFSSHVAAGVTSVLTALGLTWKAVGDFFGRAAAKSEQALWDAQVDWTIAYRCTIPIVKPPERRRRNKRKERIDDHFDTWSGWLERWPGLTGEDPPAATPEPADARRS